MFTEFIEKISEIPAGFNAAINDLMGSPVSVAAIALLMLAAVLIARFSKIKFTPRVMAHVALAVAMTVVLNMFVLFRMPQGGSVTLASMVPIFFIAFIYGPNIGVLTGLLFGVINLLLGGVIVHPIQILLDYPVPFMLLGLAGYLPKKMNIGMILATVLRFASHVISGFVFFAQYAPEGMNPLIYSMIYNGPFLVADLLIALVVINILPVKKLGRRMLGKDLDLRYW